LLQPAVLGRHENPEQRVHHHRVGQQVLLAERLQDAQSRGEQHDQADAHHGTTHDPDRSNWSRGGPRENGRFHADKRVRYSAVRGNERAGSPDPSAGATRQAPPLDFAAA